MSNSFSLEGLGNFERSLIRTINQKYPEEAKKFMKKQVSDVRKQARDDTPEDTGELKKNWKTSTKGKKKASATVIESTITNDSPHSHLVEDGHVIANQYGEFGFYPGAHMLEKAVEKKNSEFQRELNEFLDKALEELAL
jgi:hypothetical protein